MIWHFIYNRTQTTYTLLNVGKYTIFREKGKFECDGSNTSQKSWEECHKKLEKKVALKQNNYGNILQLIVSEVNIMIGYNAHGTGRVFQK